MQNKVVIMEKKRNNTRGREESTRKKKKPFCVQKIYTSRTLNFIQQQIKNITSNEYQDTNTKN